MPKHQCQDATLKKQLLQGKWKEGKNKDKDRNKWNTKYATENVKKAESWTIEKANKIDKNHWKE